MNYKGYTLKLSYSFTLPFGGRVTGVGIFQGDTFLAVAQDKELAMRVVDERIKHEKRTRAKSAGAVSEVRETAPAGVRHVRESSQAVTTPSKGKVPHIRGHEKVSKVRGVPR